MLRLSRDAGELVELLRSAALTTDVERLEEVEELFTEHLEHSQEVYIYLHILIHNSTYKQPFANNLLI